jgi:hypothetical protein
MEFSMHDERFDLLVTELPRRGLLGVAAGLSVLALGHPAVEARRKKHKKRKKCKRGTTKCAGACVDLSTDSANCGGCGVVCTGGKSCSAGKCACPADQSFIAGVCIPRFGCTLELDSCEVGKKACPVTTNLSDARCYVSDAGEPFCATALDCLTNATGGVCPAIGGKNRIPIPCRVCDDPDEIGGCVLPIVQPRSDP